MILEWVFDQVIRGSRGGPSCWSRLRRGVLLTIGVGCVALGLVLMGTLVRAETLGTLGTAQLLGIVVLIAGPALSLGALGLDRTAHERAAKVWVIADDAPEACAEIRVCVTHDAHPRSPKPAPHARSIEQDGQAQPALGAA